MSYRSSVFIAFRRRRRHRRAQGTDDVTPGGGGGGIVCAVAACTTPSRRRIPRAATAASRPRSVSALRVFRPISARRDDETDLDIDINNDTNVAAQTTAIPGPRRGGARVTRGRGRGPNNGIFTAVRPRLSRRRFPWDPGSARRAPQTRLRNSRKTDLFLCTRGGGGGDSGREWYVVVVQSMLTVGSRSAVGWMHIDLAPYTYRPRRYCLPRDLWTRHFTLCVLAAGRRPNGGITRNAFSRRSGNHSNNWNLPRWVTGERYLQNYLLFSVSIDSLYLTSTPFSKGSYFCWCGLLFIFFFSIIFNSNSNYIVHSLKFIVYYMSMTAKPFWYFTIAVTK